MMYFCISLGILFLALLVKTVSALRLTIPLLYALLVPILFRDWYYAHETLGNGIFFALLGLVILSWIISIVKKIRKII